MLKKITAFTRKEPFNLLLKYPKKKDLASIFSCKDILLHYSIVFIPTIILCVVLLFLFPSEQNITLFFEEYKKNVPLFTYCINMYTLSANWLFFAYFVLIFMVGLKQKDHKKKQLFFAYICTQIIFNFFLVAVLKVAIGRPRPHTGLEEFQFFSFNSENHSVPSGHTTENASITSGLALYYKKIAISILLGTLTFLMAFSRIYLSHHRPTDVLFSLFIALFAGLFMNYLAGLEGLKNFSIYAFFLAILFIFSKYLF